jgi:xanthine/uracil/vitamin C permease (AzgA family)
MVEFIFDTLGTASAIAEEAKLIVPSVAGNSRNPRDPASVDFRPAPQFGGGCWGPKPRSRATSRSAAGRRGRGANGIAFRSSSDCFFCWRSLQRARGKFGPGAATAPALILVGFPDDLADRPGSFFSDVESAIPLRFVTLLTVPLTLFDRRTVIG